MAPRRSARVAASAAPTPSTTTPSAPAPPTKKKTTTTKSGSTKRKATAASHAPNKIRKTQLATPLAAKGPLGVVDPASGVENGSIVVHDGAPCDVLLSLVDPSQHSDKYYLQQWIETDDNNYVVYTRWGRTGTKGQALTQSFEDYEAARKAFESKFQQKSGLAWTDRHDAPLAGKYRVLQQDYTAKAAGYVGSAAWQYWVDDGVDGKTNGWYDYDQAGSAGVEQLHSCQLQNPGMSKRWIESGSFTYEVDLDAMTQTNTSTKTVRTIRRCPVDQVMDESAPPPPTTTTVASSLTAAPPAATTTTTTKTLKTPAKKAAVQVTPNSTPKKKAPPSAAAAPAPSAAPAPPAAAAAPKAKSHPVDPDIVLFGKRPSDWTVVMDPDHTETGLDAVLNQCNITGSSNNNKYYRLQVLQSKSNSQTQFACWQKWGRVGEPARASSAAWKAASSLQGAVQEYAKKFRAKTGNHYQADPFVPKSGKYTKIEIDHDVQVTEDVVGRPLKSAPEVKYRPSELDPKTQDLLETLFSKEMRDQALTSFNLDLKRLPLGVPSKTQIEHGIAILKQIQNKLAGQPEPSSYDELSSRFFTAIPHSFGRARPPSIRTPEALQSRFDVCDILLDMYDTNEAVRKIEQEQKEQQEVEERPNPVDLHYQTLHADLDVVDPKSDDFEKIKVYFDKTKSNPRAQLLNAWTVNRHGEADRFQKFDKLDNRRLLWHGTNIAVVAPILTSGLRIMPHSGGRVGSGIYLASMQAKSAQYTSGYGAKYACMFLAEAALGKMHPITSDGSHASSLKKAPAGFDSVHAVGKISPLEWTTTTMDGKEVQLPKSEAEETGTASSFYHDEFLAYEEAQVRLRYVLTVRL